MTSSEIRALRDQTGVPFGSLESIDVQCRQLARDGLSRGQIIHAVQNLHPILMENLVIGAGWTIKPRNPRYVWAGRGWRRK